MMWIFYSRINITNDSPAVSLEEHSSESVIVTPGFQLPMTPVHETSHLNHSNLFEITRLTLHQNKGCIAEERLAEQIRKYKHNFWTWLDVILIIAAVVNTGAPRMQSTRTKLKQYTKERTRHISRKNCPGDSHEYMLSQDRNGEKKLVFMGNTKYMPEMSNAVLSDQETLQALYQEITEHIHFCCIR